MFVVIDTNVLFSRFAGRGGAPVRIFSLLEKRRFSLVTSDQILFEYADVLSRPVMRERYGVRPEDLDLLISGLRFQSKHVEIEERLTVVQSDPSDNKFIEAAVAGEAEFIISGDKHLLALAEFRGILIVTPAAFVAYLERDGR